MAEALALAIAERTAALRREIADELRSQAPSLHAKYVSGNLSDAQVLMMLEDPPASQAREDRKASRPLKVVNMVQKGQTMEEPLPVRGRVLSESTKRRRQSSFV